MKITDCPHKPGTPEHNAWVKDVYTPWQHRDLDHLVERERTWQQREAMVERGGRLTTRDALTDEERAADAVYAEVEEATGQRRSRFAHSSNRIVILGGGGALDISHLITNIRIDVNPFTQAMERLSAQMAADENFAADWLKAIADMPTKTGGLRPSFTVTDEVLPTSRHAKAKTNGKPSARRRAIAAAPCHHGNPRNACRDCSMGRR
jgi:hypothetical protein